MVFAADGVILDGSHDRLPGVNDFQVLDAALAALGAHDLGQRADGSLINIRDLEAGRVHLVARTHGADDGDASLLALHDQRDFTGDSVDGVYHVVELAEIGYTWNVGFPIVVNAGIFNGSGLTNQKDYWAKGVNYSAKAQFLFPNVNLVLSTQKIKPSDVTVTMYDGGITFHKGGF